MIIDRHMTPFPIGAMLAAYLRDSGGDKQDLSVSQQETAIRAWCNDHGYILTAVFADRARPGSSTVGRQAFQDMMRHFRDPACQEAGLVIWDYKRFAREINDAQFFRADLRRRGYILHSLNDQVPDGKIGHVFEAFIDWHNDQFLEDLSRDVRRGLRSLVKSYGAVPGTPPRGFKREPVQLPDRRDNKQHIVHRWVPDPDLAPKVVQAFAMRLAGKSLAEINAATRLFGSLNSYTTFFANSIYKGELHFGDLVIPDYCAPVVDPATWELVQGTVRRYKMHQNLTGDNPDHPRRARSVYLLSGLLYCARCGSPYAGQRERHIQRDIERRSYLCSKAKRTRACDAGPSIPMQWLDDQVRSEVLEHILQPGILLGVQEQIHTAEHGLRANLETALADEGKRLAGLRRQIANITDAIAVNGSSRALQEKLIALETAEADNLAAIARLELQLAAPLPDHTPAALGQLADQLRTLIEDPDIAIARAALRGLVHRITVDREGSAVRCAIEYFFPDLKSMPMSPVPVGAPFQRHVFTHAFSALITRSYIKRKRR